MKINKWINPLGKTITTTLLGVILGVVIESFLDPLFQSDTLILGLISLLAILSVIAIVVVTFFAKNSELREERWLEIQNYLGSPAEIVFDTISNDGEFNRRLSEIIKDIEAGDEILVMSYYATHGSDSEKQKSKKFEDALKDYSENLLKKAKEPNIIYRRLICFDNEGLTVKPWMREHAKKMLEIKSRKPSQITLKKGRVRLRADLFIIRGKKALVSLDVYEKGSGIFGTAGALIFHNPPNKEIVDKLYDLFLVADSEGIPIEKIPQDWESSS